MDGEKGNTEKKSEKNLKSLLGLSRNVKLVSDSSNDNETNSKELPKKRSKVVQFNTVEKNNIIDTASKTGKLILFRKKNFRFE